MKFVGIRIEFDRALVSLDSCIVNSVFVSEIFSFSSLDEDDESDETEEAEESESDEYDECSVLFASMIVLSECAGIELDLILSELTTFGRTGGIFRFNSEGRTGGGVSLLGVGRGGGFPTFSPSSSCCASIFGSSGDGC